MNKKILSILSICKKAGKILSGEYAVEKAIQEKKALYVIIPEDASDNTKKKFINKATYYKIDYIVYGQKEILSHAIGAVNKTTYAIMEEGFYKTLKENIKKDIKNTENDTKR